MCKDDYVSIVEESLGHIFCTIYPCQCRAEKGVFWAVSMMVANMWLLSKPCNLDVTSSRGDLLAKRLMATNVKQSGCLGNIAIAERGRRKQTTRENYPKCLKMPAPLNVK